MKITVAFLAFVTGGHLALSQGFVNLNFENPILPLGPSGSFVSAANAIPGWTAYLGGGAQSSIAYNGISIGGSMVSLNDTNSNGSQPNPFPIQGNYSVFLWASSFAGQPSASVGQTGQISNLAKTLIFWATFNGIQVSFNGQAISFFMTGSTANYNIYAADISAYAGQTGELRFTTPSLSPLSSFTLLDNIQFSSMVVPEPSTFALAALGGLLLGFRRWRKYITLIWWTALDD